MKRITLFILIATLFIACDNTKKIDSTKQTETKVGKVEYEKNKYQTELDSLNNVVSELEEKKKQIIENKNIASAEIFNIVKSSFLDHVIIGSKNLNETTDFFSNYLGFQIKKGRNHENGINNVFIEFPDSSEIEIIATTNPKDQIAKNYSDKINNGLYGLGFSIRTNRINKLYQNFSKTKGPFSNINRTKSFTTLTSTNNYQQPFFFIEYNTIQHSFSSNTNIKGLNSVWISTKEIRKSIKQYSELGFTLIDTLSIKSINNKKAWLKNNNFSLIIIEDDYNGIKGFSLKVKNIQSLLTKYISKIDNSLEIQKHKRGKSIYLSPEITKSVWIELIE